MNVLRAWCVCAALAAVGAAPLTVAIADPAPAAVGAAPFVNHEQMLNWLADSERGLWIQSIDLNWFYARFDTLCHGLNVTNSLVFETPASGNFDRSSSVVVPGNGRCVVQSFVTSVGPPKDRNAGVVTQPQAQ
jgi:hypothetical protein